MKDTAAALEGTWQAPGNRSVWVSSSRRAQKLSGQQGALPDRPVRAAEASGEHRKLNAVLAGVGGIAFFVIAVLLASECFKAFAYKSHLHTGMQAMERGRYDQAAVEFSLCIAASPSATAFYQRGLAELACHFYDNALTDCNKALALDPQNNDALLTRGLLNLKVQQYKEALVDCNRVIAADPNCIDAYRIRANANNHLGRYADAIADSSVFLNRYDACDELRADALAKRAFALDRKHDYEHALADYCAAIECDRSNSSLYAGRAIVLMHSGAWEKAIADCDRALKIEVNDPVPYKVRGLCFAKLHMDERALEDLDELVMRHPSVEAHKLRGETRLEAGDYLGTLADFDCVLDANPADASVARKYQEAKTALQSTVQQDVALSGKQAAM